jgi:hypothetical protein
LAVGPAPVSPCPAALALKEEQMSMIASSEAGSVTAGDLVAKAERIRELLEAARIAEVEAYERTMELHKLLDDSCAVVFERYGTELTQMVSYLADCLDPDSVRDVDAAQEAGDVLDFMRFAEKGRGDAHTMVEAAH